MARRSIPNETKVAILAEAQIEGAKLPAIAAKYAVSLPTVYNYLRSAKVVEIVPETPVV